MLHTSTRMMESLSGFPYFFIFEDQLNHPEYPGFKSISGASQSPSLLIDSKNYKDWENIIDEKKQTREEIQFYFISYEFRKAIEKLKTQLPPIEPSFPWVAGIKPEMLFSSSKKNNWELKFNNSKIVHGNCSPKYTSFELIKPPKALETKKEYTSKIKLIKQKITEGLVYELNYCLFFEAKIKGFDAVDAYQRITELSPMPFSALVKWDTEYIICASPELFMSFDGTFLKTKPIKGTIKKDDHISYNDAVKLLQCSEKERAENMMIVDLSRNDLNKYCIPGSVTVPELFGVYEFPHLYHMISTISGIPAHETAFRTMLKSFPMGSMTGAPKIAAMEIIESIEPKSRGMFSGSIGYIMPNGHYDFNVVIRSIFYNSETGSLRFMAGSAITIDSDPEKEYDECLTKAKSIIQIIEEIACLKPQ